MFVGKRADLSTPAPKAKKKTTSVHFVLIVECFIILSFLFFFLFFFKLFFQ